MSRDIRRLSKVSLFECSNVEDSGVTLLIYGRNSRNKDMMMKVRLEWWIVPYLVRQLAKEWVKSKANRLSEIAALDEVLKPE